MTKCAFCLKNIEESHTYLCIYEFREDGGSPKEPFCNRDCLNKYFDKKWQKLKQEFKDTVVFYTKQVKWKHMRDTFQELVDRMTELEGNKTKCNSCKRRSCCHQDLGEMGLCISDDYSGYVKKEIK